MIYIILYATVYIFLVILYMYNCKQGRRHEFEGWGVNEFEVGGSILKTLQFENGVRCMTPPPSSYGGAAPALSKYCYLKLLHSNGLRTVKFMTETFYRPIHRLCILIFHN